MRCVAAVLMAIFTLSPNSLMSAEPGAAGVVQPRIMELSQQQIPFTVVFDGIESTIEATALDTTYTDGESAFVQLTFANDHPSKQSASAELTLDTEYGEIASVAGRGVKSEAAGGVRIVRIASIKRDETRRVLVEVKLQGDAGNPVSKLNVSMRAPDDEDETASRQHRPLISDEPVVSLSWPVAPCGLRYHAALQTIGENGGNSLRDVWRAVQKHPDGMSRRWNFRPVIPRRNSRSRVEPTDGLPTAQVRQILTETAALMRSGSYRDLRRRGRYGWTISKTANDLRKYFSQDHNPAICTGAPAFAAYYEDQLAPLGRRSARLQSLVADAEILSRTRAVAFIENTRNLPGGHPAWGGARLETLVSAPQGSDDDEMQSLIVRMIHAAGVRPSVIDEIVNANSGYDAIERLDDIGLSDAGVSSRSQRSELGQALAAIEAAIRLAVYSEHYDKFWTGFSGNLTAIRAAHAEHCLCGS